MLYLSRIQRANGLVILYRVAQLARQGSWDLLDVRRVGRLCICCALTESSLWIYANSNVPSSMELYSEKIGHDHLSVGLYQQQVPSWGDAATCMDPIRSTDLFVSELLRANLTRVSSGVLPWVAIQKVQNSAYQDGSNYRRNYPRAVLFVRVNRLVLTP